MTVVPWGVLVLAGALAGCAGGGAPGAAPASSTEPAAVVATGRVALADAAGVRARFVPPAAGFVLGTSDAATSARASLEQAFPPGYVATAAVYDDGTGRLAIVVALAAPTPVPAGGLGAAATAALVSLRATDTRPAGAAEALGTLGNGAVGVLATTDGLLLVVQRSADQTQAQIELDTEAAALGLPS